MQPVFHQPGRTLTCEVRNSRPSYLGGSLAGLVQFAQGAVRRVFVDVAQGRVVEDRVDEEVYVAAET